MVVGGGIVGMAIASHLQQWAAVTLVDDSFFPGLGETSRALGILRRSFPERNLADYAGPTWDFTLAQHENPKSPVRVRLVPLNEEPDAAAYLDHLLLLDAYLFLFRRRGGIIQARTEATKIVPRDSGRCFDVVTRTDADEQIFPADAVVIAPGPRLDALNLVPSAPLTENVFPVMDLVIPFVLPPQNDWPGGITVSGDYTIVQGLKPHRTLIVYRMENNWQLPDFEELASIIEDMQHDLNIPGEALVDEIQICRDLASPNGRPLIKMVTLPGAGPICWALAMGLNGLSIAGGVAVEVSGKLSRYFSVG